MRRRLKRLECERTYFRAIFIRFGKSYSRNGVNKTILLKNIRDRKGKILAEHVWVHYNKNFEKIDLRRGDELLINAEVGEYRKFNTADKIKRDYTLKNILEVKKIS